MRITSPNLDDGTRATPELRRNETQVKFELVKNVEEFKPRRPGIFSGIARFLGALSPIGAFFGPLGLIGTAVGAGLGSIGAKAQDTHLRKEQERLSQVNRQVVTTPGLTPWTLASDPTLETIANSQNNAMVSAIKGM